MLFFRKKGNIAHSHLTDYKNYIQSSRFQRFLIGIVTILISFIIIETGAMPTKYSLSVGDKFQYDTIVAPRELENELKTEQNRQAAMESVNPVMKEISAVPIEVLKTADDLFMAFETARKDVEKSLENQGITKRNKNYKQLLANEQEVALGKLSNEIKKLNIPLTPEQLRFIIEKPSDDELTMFKKVTKDMLGDIMKGDIPDSELLNKIDTVQKLIQLENMDLELKNLGSQLFKLLIKPNRTIDKEMTEAKKKEAHDSADNLVKIAKDSKIISKGDIVTADVLKILEQLNLVETKGKIDFAFAGGIFTIILMLAILLIMFMNRFCRHVLYSRRDLILFGSVIILTLLVARAVESYLYSLAIPIFIFTMLISILLNLELAIVSNCTIAFAISFIVKGDIRFIYMSIISGTLAAFIVSKVTQRSKFTIAGFVVGFVNVLVIICFGIIYKYDVRTIVNDSVVVFLNGIVSIIITVGMLPFLESIFNLITPLKLLELANPNQPLIKRLLMEAPGTYHHSLMVGNLAEVATDAIGGNALLARVGAYFHDVGKLKRPNFFKENQLSDNPHDRMTANLSTLVITSHTKDGVELAEKYKIPLAIRDIILQHHGTTLVAYFFHKAKKCERGEPIKQDNFRYEGPRPTSKEAAVVMLADSVEAAVRSMVDKTEGKIEGLVRKIIKDKLDDGQLDLCNLTLKDLDLIAKGFMRVLSGYFHERTEYPEIKDLKKEYIPEKSEDPLEKLIESNKIVEEENTLNENLN